MNFQIRQSKRQQAKLRIGMSGPSGSGKTHSALVLARGLTDSWEKIVVIDTENGSADLYSHLWDYQVLPMTPPFSPERYIQAIKMCEEAWFEVIVIDSTSHEWEGEWGCLEINDIIAKTKFKGNTWWAWSETTPRHQKFIQAITQSRAHVITTARSKTDMAQVDGKVKKVGTKEIQREWFEYELTLNFNIDRDGHFAIASKDRTGIFIDRDPFLISQKTGEEILSWNNSWAEPIKVPTEEELLAKLEEEKSEFFNAYYDSLQSAKTLAQLEEMISDFKVSLKERGQEYMKDARVTSHIGSLIQDMKASLTSKEAKIEEDMKKTHETSSESVQKSSELQSEVKEVKNETEVKPVHHTDVPAVPFEDEVKQERIQKGKEVIDTVLLKSGDGLCRPVPLASKKEAATEDLGYPPEWDTTHPDYAEENAPATFRP